jgi:integrase
MTKGPKKFTALSVKAFKAGPERQEIPDPGCAGLYLIIQPEPSAAKSWATRYRFAGRTRKLTHGGYPPLSLARARMLNTTALAKVATGVDPAAENRQAKASAVDKSRDTVVALAEKYFEHARKRMRKSSFEAVEGSFRRDVLPVWSKRLVADVSRRDARELVGKVAETRPVMANRLQAHLFTFFRWCVDEDVITGSPIIGMKRPTKEEPRERALADDELRAFWIATDALFKPFGDIFKLLLLSGTRRQEVAAMEWREVDLAKRIWELPGARSKNRKPIMLPLGPLAWSIIEKQPRLVGSGHVFGWRRSGFSYAKAKLDALMLPKEPWRTHDLRRTARSLLSRAKVPSDTAELCLGHLLPGAIRRTYDKHGYVDEKRAAFTALEREVDLILNPPAADVIPLRR